MHRTRTLVVAALLATAMTPLLPARPAAAASGSFAVTQRVSMDAAGKGGANDVDNNVFVDETGRYVFFNTDNQLLPSDKDASWDSYRFDRLGNRLQIVSVDGPPDDPDHFSHPTRTCGISRDGRYAVMAITNGTTQVFRHDLATGEYEHASASNGGSLASMNGADAIVPDDRCAVSDNGRYVAFQARATNLVAGNTDVGSDIYRRDLETDTIQLVSQSSGGVKGDAPSRSLAMSASGSAVAFASTATNLVAGDSNGAQDVFLRLFTPAATLRMSVKTGGGQIAGASGNPAISANGTYVVFESAADQIVALDSNGQQDVFMRNRLSEATALVSLTDADAPVVGGPSYNPAVSDDGRYVSFGSLGTNLPGNASQGKDEDHVYRRDLDLGSTVLLDIGPTGNVGDDESYGQSISGDGRVVAFASKASNLDQSDGSHVKDAFVRDLGVPTAPFDTEWKWIAQQWLDFHGKAIPANDLEILANRLSHGKLSLESIVDDLAHVPEFAAKRAPLVRLYWAYFLRPPDIGGLNYWTNKLKAGSKLAGVSQQFAKSSEFQNKYGSLSNQAFVTKIYQNIFERNPDAGGLAYWTGKLDKKQKTRGDVMVNFSESSEGKRVLAPQTDTVLIWFGMLRSTPSKPLTEGFRQGIKAGQPAEIVVRHVRDLFAYTKRFA